MGVSERAVVEPGVELGSGVSIWHFTHVRENVVLGEGTRIGSHCYIDAGVRIGRRCKIQNGCMVYRPARLGDGVFLGPGVLVLNDRHPRAVDERGELLGTEGWRAEAVTILDRASIGAGAILMPGVTIGRGAVVGAGAVVTCDVADGTRVVGAPARTLGEGRRGPSKEQAG